MIEADTIERLTHVRGDGIPVLSLYLHVDAERRRFETALASLLDQVRPLAYDDSVDRDARLSMREDIAHIERVATRNRWKLGTVGLFSSSRRGLFEEVELPRPVHEQVVVDSTPWVRPLLAVLGEYHRTCVVMVDRSMTRMWELYQDELRELTAFRDESLRQPNHAAWRTEHGVRHRDGELVKKHFRRTAELLERMFRADGYELLIVGGRPEDVPSFVEQLSPELRARVAGTFDVDVSGTAAADVRRSADTVLERYERDDDRRQVIEVLGLAGMGGSAAVGLDDCLWAASVLGVQSLLVQEGAAVPGVVCHRSGWLALSGASCPVCGEPTRSTPDVVDELVTAVIEDGGTVRHIRAQTELARHVCAARLRFPLPPRPAG